MKGARSTSQIALQVRKIRKVMIRATRLLRLNERYSTIAYGSLDEVIGFKLPGLVDQHFYPAGNIGL